MTTDEELTQREVWDRMDINLALTKLMTMGGTRKLHVEVDGPEFEQVNEFGNIG